MAVSSWSCALWAPRQPIRLRRLVPGERLSGEVGERAEALTHVDEMLRMMVRRGKSGEEGVGDLLVSITVTVAEGDWDERLEGRRVGVEGDMAVKRRDTEADGNDLAEEAEAMEMVEERGRRAERASASKASSSETSCWSSGRDALKREALGVAASSPSSKQDRRDGASEPAAFPWCAEEAASDESVRMDGGF